MLYSSSFNSVSTKPGHVAVIQQDCKNEKKQNNIKMKKIFFILYTLLNQI